MSVFFFFLILWIILWLFTDSPWTYLLYFIGGTIGLVLVWEVLQKLYYYTKQVVVFTYRYLLLPAIVIVALIYFWDEVFEGLMFIHQSIMDQPYNYGFIAILGGIYYLFKPNEGSVNKYISSKTISQVNMLWMFLGITILNYAVVSILTLDVITVTFNDFISVLHVGSIDKRFAILRHLANDFSLLFVKEYIKVGTLFILSGIFFYKLLTRAQYDSTLEDTGYITKLKETRCANVLSASIMYLIFNVLNIPILAENIAFSIAAILLAIIPPMKSPDKILQLILLKLAIDTRTTVDEIHNYLVSKNIELPKSELEVFLEILILEGGIINLYGNLYHVNTMSNVLKKLEEEYDYVGVQKVLERLNITSVYGSDIDKNKVPEDNSNIDALACLLVSDNFAGGYIKSSAQFTLVNTAGAYSVCEYCETAYKKEERYDNYCCDACATADKNEKNLAITLSNDISRKHISSAMYQIPTEVHDVYLEEESKNPGNGGVYATVVEEVDRTRHMLSTPQGHGFAAEEANTLIDTVTGKDAQVVGYDNAKSGADRCVDGMLIQTKYYKTVSGSIGACFENGAYKYLKPNGKPMQVEIPADQYEKGVRLMQERIKNGEVPGIKDPRYARRLVRKGHVSYAQAKAAAQFGTIESLSMDLTSGAIQATNTMGITVAMELANSLWRGESVDKALERACSSLVSVGGRTLAISTISSQILRTSAGSFVRQSAGVILKETGEIFFSKATSQMLGNIAKNNIITGGITLAVMNSDKFDQYMSGKISGREFGNAVGSSALSLAGGVAGGQALGGVIGSLIPVPFVGTLIGATVGGFVGSAIGKLFFNNEKYEEERRREAEREYLAEKQRIEQENRDVQAFFEVLNKQLSKWVNVYILSECETEEVIQKVSEGYGLDSYDLRLSFLNKARSSNGQIAEATIYLKQLIVEIVSNRPVVETIEADVVGKSLLGYIGKAEA